MPINNFIEAFEVIKLDEFFQQNAPCFNNDGNNEKKGEKNENNNITGSQYNQTDIENEQSKSIIFADKNYKKEEKKIDHIDYQNNINGEEIEKENKKKEKKCIFYCVK
jgi:hypothetical protein